ncbi:MAG TPA: LppX_LprAFG lipoprotein [Acidimicrobiales bacterium]
MRFGAAALGAAALVAALAGCGDGGGGDGGGPHVRAVDLRAVRAVPDDVADAGTFSFEMTTTYLLGRIGGVGVTFGGSVDVDADRAALEADVTDFVTEFLIPISQAGRGPSPVDEPTEPVIVPIVVDGDVGYADLTALEELAPNDQRRADGRRWVRFGAEDVGVEGSPFAAITRLANPEGILALLGAATGDVETVGEDEVRGEPATHVQTTIDLAAARDQGPDGEWPMLDALAGEGDSRIDTVPVDLWIGEDGLLRRFRVEVEREAAARTNAPDGPPVAADAVGTIGSLTYEAFDYGEPVDVEVPDPDDVTDPPR